VRFAHPQVATLIKLAPILVSGAYLATAVVMDGALQPLRPSPADLTSAPPGLAAAVATAVANWTERFATVPTPASTAIADATCSTSELGSRDAFCEHQHTNRGGDQQIQHIDP
jgi:hypothetical protein